jgi:hypothetical protein
MARSARRLVAVRKRQRKASFDRYDPTKALTQMTLCSPGGQADEEFLSDIGSRAISWQRDQKKLSNPPGDNL